MKQIDATVDGKSYRFRTNEDGCGLFVGDGENRQISSDSGFGSLRAIKRAIRNHLAPCGRIRYREVIPGDFAV